MSHDAPSMDELLNELSELRELDQRRNAHAPGSPAHDRVTRELEDRTRNLMDRFRDLKLLRPPTTHRLTAEPTAAMPLHLARASAGTTIWATRTG